MARITRDGVLLEEIDLNQVEKPYSLTLEDGSGSNTVLVEPHRLIVEIVGAGGELDGGAG